MAKRKKTFFWWPGLTIFVIGMIALLLSKTVLKDWIIICFGVRALKVICNAESALLGGGLSYAILQHAPVIRSLIAERRQRQEEKSRKQQQSQMMVDYMEDSDNPELTRKRLEQLRSEMPELTMLIEQCIQQMDKMDALQEKQSLLIATNDARYLRKTIEVFNNVEGRICRNFRNVINLCIAADGAADIDMKKVDRFLDDNEKKLEDTRRLLKASADWINQYEADERENDCREVENWIAIIRESLKEGD